MSSNDKLAAAFRRVEESLAQAEEALARNDMARLSKKIWEAGADLEYVLFTLHLSLGEAGDSRQEKPRAQKAASIEAEILEAKCLSGEACLVAGSNCEEAYRKAWLARGATLRAEKMLSTSAGRGR